MALVCYPYSFLLRKPFPKISHVNLRHLSIECYPTIICESYYSLLALLLVSNSLRSLVCHGIDSSTRSESILGCSTAPSMGRTVVSPITMAHLFGICVVWRFKRREFALEDGFKFSFFQWIISSKNIALLFMAKLMY